MRQSKKFEGDLLTRQVKVMFTDAQGEALQRLAAQSGLSMSEFIRGLVVKKIEYGHKRNRKKAA